MGLRLLVHADSGVPNLEHDLSTELKIFIGGALLDVNVSSLDGQCAALQHSIAGNER
jgi:hypothetical protein